MLAQEKKLGLKRRHSNVHYIPFETVSMLYMYYAQRARHMESHVPLMYTADVPLLQSLDSSLATVFATHLHDSH